MAIQRSIVLPFSTHESIEGSRAVALGLAWKVLAGPFSTGHPIPLNMTEGSSGSSEHPRREVDLQERNMAEMKKKKKTQTTDLQHFPLNIPSKIPVIPSPKGTEKVEGDEKGRGREE